MKLTSRMLRRMINEEMNRERAIRRRRRSLAESAERPVRVTPQYINRLIKEEYAAFQKKQRLAESRRRRVAIARRRRALSRY